MKLKRIAARLAIPPQLLILMLIAALPLSAAAETPNIYVNNIKYTIDTSSGEASVVKQSTSMSISDITIVSSVSYNGKDYPVTSIEERAFENGINFKGSLFIPESVTYIGRRAFYHCTGLTGSLNIPNSVTSIGEYTFYECSGFTGSLNIPDAVTSIGQYAFYKCSGFTGSLNIPDAVTSIGKSAFNGCSGFTGSLIIPESVTSIESLAFCGCSGLTGPLNIPESVTSIESSAFSGCKGFNGSLIIPEGVTSIGSYAFDGCKGFNGSLSIPNSVTSIGSYAFQNCSGFTGSLNIPESVTSIKSSAFSGCSGFTGTLNIPESVTSIESDAFYNCSGFTGSLNIPNSVTSIGSYAFIGCQGFSGSLIIPESVTSIGSGAFLYNCGDFNVIYCKATTPPEIESDTFGSTLKKVRLIVPETSVNSYKTTSYWEEFVNIGILPFSISLNKPEIVIGKSESYTLAATVLPEDAYYEKIIWTSSSDNTATVDENGTVTGIALGKATISASVNDDLTASATVYVGQIELLEQEVLTIGESKILKPAIMPQDMPEMPIEWSSSDEKVATVDAEGKVTAVALGNATITATISEYISAECEVYVCSLSISGNSDYLRQKETLQLNAEYLPEDLPDRTLTWSSSDDAVATVDENGLVKGVAPGNVTITATTAYGHSASFDILVWTFSFPQPQLVVPVGESETIVPVIAPQSLAQQPIAWSSSDDKVATVDAEGKVTAVAPGKAIITATIGENLSAECEAYVSSLSISGDRSNIKTGETLQLANELLPEDLPDRTLTWSSSDEAVATVDENGLVKGVAPGNVTITATTAYGHSATFDILVWTFSFQQPQLIISVGESETIVPVIAPQSLAQQPIAWSSSDDKVATVDAEGKVTAVAPGKAIITATVGENLSAECEVLVPGVSFDTTETSLVPGESMQLEALLIPDELPDRTLTWSTSDEAVATVDSEGKVTGVAPGTAVITATSAYRASASCTVHVSGMSLTVKEAILAKGEDVKIDLNLTDDVADAKVEWASSDEAVATVGADGTVHAIGVGTATVTATMENGLTADATIYVAAIELSHSSLTAESGETTTLSATVAPDALSDHEVIWKSSDESVATVDAEGHVKASAIGTAVITATLTDNKAVAASCTINVTSRAGDVAFRYDAGLGGAVVYSIPDQECYVVPQTVSLPDGRSYAVKGVMLDEQPASLRKVAYPQGARTNFSATVVAVPYDADCNVANGLITDPAAGRLVFVDMAASGAFEIPATIGSVGPDAFALCSGITSLVIADSDDVLAFEGTTFDGRPVFAASPLTSIHMGRNIAADESPFRGNTTLAELTLGSDVTSIANNMFRECTALRELSLPASLTEAGYASFGFCTGLSQVFLEDSRNAIDLTSAFLGSTMDYLYMGRPVTGNAQWPRTLKAIETGRDVDTLGPSAFIDLPNLYSLTIGVGMRTLDVDAFKGSKITKVIWLPNTPPTGYDKIVADINYVSTTNYELDNMTVSANLSAKFMVDGLVYVFNKRAADRTCAVIDSHYNRYLTALDVPHKVTYQGIEFTVEEINDYALYANRYFRTASIGDGIVSIGRYALFCCDGIDSAPYIGKAVQTIGDHAFFGCSGIPSVIIPDATEFLGPWSLASCTALQSAILGAGLQVIEQGCFSDDISLLQIVVPANVQTIANQVFDRCTSLAYLEISDRTSTLTMGYSEHNDAYKPSDGTIGGLATAGVPLFYYCPLKEAYIGGDISYSTSPADGYSPFYRNDYLEKVIIYNNETEISDNEFYGCRNLHEVVVGNDVTRVGNYAFSGCLNLEYFTLGSHVKTIGIDAFSDCDKMKELRSYNPEPPVCGDQAMDDINVFSCTLYVPHSAVEAYKNAPQWENFFHIEGMDTETIPVEAITLDPEEWSGPLGSEFRITATVAPYNADNKALSWSSSDTSVATVDSEGRVSVNGIGSCVITARANDGSGVSATCEVTVLPIVAEQIVLSQTEAEIEIFKTLQLTATVKPENVTDPTITWSSSDESVATVDEDGLVKAVAVGTATITASCGEASATCEVTVIDKLSALLELSADGEGPLTVYTLGGVRLDIPTVDELRKLEPGFYIINGKKILLK